MYQASKTPQRDSTVSVVGAGIAGSWQALAFARAGFGVTLYERGTADMTQATSHWAGGMLAPWCEREASEPVITRLGIRSLDLWREQLPETPFNGSLVVAHPRDRADFDRFAKLTTDFERLDKDGIAKLEPSLDGKFREALFFAHEGHVEPRTVLTKLHKKITAAGGSIKFESDHSPAS
jgi:glycine oxidase